MSTNIRPVREDWGPHSSRFIDSETTFCELMDFLAVTADTTVEESPRQESTQFWFQDGAAILDLLANSEPETLLRSLLARHPETRKERNQIRSLLQNLRALSPSWRPLLDRDDQSLRILSD